MDFGCVCIQTLLTNRVCANDKKGLGELHDNSWTSYMSQL